MSTPGHATFNNQIVEALRNGSRDRVDALLMFGLSPEKNIDLVNYSKSSSPAVTTRSAWFWSHQAPKEDGVMAWWDWLDRSLGTMQDAKRAPMLGKLFLEAMEAGMPQAQGNTVVATWSRALSWASEDRAPGWSRQMMMACLASTCAKLGNVSTHGLHALEFNGLIAKNDWSNASRRRYPQDPLSVAVSKVQVDLVELLLDMGCEPTLQDGRPLMGEAWACFENYFSTSQQQLSNEEDYSALLLERLLARNLDWRVPSATDKNKTVAEEAERWLDRLKVDPEKWEGVSRQIEARILMQKTAIDGPAASHKSRPRL